MNIIYKTYKFELKPNNNQKLSLNNNFGCSRFVYNHFLNERKLQYQKNKTSDKYYKQCSELTILKKQPNFKWLNDVNSQTLQYSLRCLDTAYLNFFRGNAKFPKFKSKKSKNSFTIPQNVKIIGKKLYIPKFKEGIKLNSHRNIKGTVKKCTISRTPTNKYYVSISTEQEYTPNQKTGEVIGIDLGIKDFIITSNGDKFKNNRYVKKYEKELKVAQQHLSRKKKGSNSHEKQRRKVAKIYEKITNSRKDNLHKVSHQLINDYDIICLEDLNIKGMVKNHKLSKHIHDASWGIFINYLEYKAEWNDKEIIKINRFFPSSKTCNVCGWIKQNLNLSDRNWICQCGKIHDRDINASLNILSEGLKIISAGTSDNTNGDINKTLIKA